MKKVITELVDPRQLGSPTWMEIRKDEMVKLAIGVRPDLLYMVDARYIRHCQELGKSIQVTALGPVGIDTSIIGIHIDRQAAIFREFLQLTRQGNHYGSIIPRI